MGVVEGDGRGQSERVGAGSATVARGVA